MAEELNHFSHDEHPLILSQVQKEIICYACQEQVLEEQAYSCIPCDFFLHKVCAELPRQIRHPMHSQHPLILLKEPPQHYHTYYCDGCGQKDWKYFTYNCSSCNFDLHVSCAVADQNFEQESGDRILQHKSHEHPLTLQQRPAIFFCDACHIEGEEEDSSYICTICAFWIHRICSSLPETVKHKHHNHSLMLAYCLPEDYRNFQQKCSVCHSKILENLWVYYCGPCRYFVHVKCVKIINTSDPIIDGESDVEDQEYIWNPNLVKLPVATPAQQLIKLFLLKRNDEGSSSSATNQNEDKMEEVALHFSHNHSLCLSTSRKNQNLTNIGEEIQICDGCMELIYVSDLHYSCFIDCGYFLHVTCSKLPNELHSTKHPEHPLILMVRLKAVGHFTCSACQRIGNGLQYKCRTCVFGICIKCASASLSTSIVHKGHKHLLTRVESSNLVECNACGYPTRGFAFACEDCDFFLDYECALLPPTFKQKKHDHLLDLLYPPFFEHPDEFYCVICELEINPNRWIYHCWECDYSLHPLCIPHFGKFKILKFGRTLCVDNHSHPLIHVPEANYKSICEECGSSLEWKVAFECESCQFYLCPYCAFEKELHINVSLLSLNE